MTMTEAKVHYTGKAHGMGRILFCSGRHVDYATTSSRLDDVTCKACRRTLIAQGKEAAAAEGEYEVKCDDCKTTIRRTSSARESYAGGRCDSCKAG